VSDQLCQSGDGLSYREAVQGDRPVVAQVRRNRWANFALWLVLVSWLVLIFRASAGELGAVDGVFDWHYLVVIAAAILVATAGVVGIRRQGEALLAVAVLAFSLVLPGVYLLALLVIRLMFSGGSVD
jgi:hypothetical protein